MFVSKQKHDKTLEELRISEKMNRELELEVQRLSKEISAQNTNCKVGAWCKDCAHVKYDKATVEHDYEYDWFTFKYKTKTAGEVMYCGKHLHDLCPEHSSHTAKPSKEE